jgi:YbbR domain-containing protein
VRHVFERINRDITTKITAALLAVLLWFIVLNINDPYIDKPLYVELEVKNEYSLMEKNLFLANKNYRKTVEVIVRGRENVVNNISPSDFDVVLDFSKVKSVNDKTISLDGPYYTKNDKQITLIGMNPKDISIELENIIRKDLSVDVELKGAPKQSYKVIRVSTEPEYVSIQDKESLVNTIDQVKAIVDVSNIDRDKKIIKQPCSVYNENGEEIASLSNRFTVDVFLEIGKEVAIVPEINGNPADDHVYTEINTNIEKAIITGPIEVLTNISNLKTGQIQIEGINETREYTVPIKLPEGVKLFNMESEVVVTVYIEKLQEKEIEIKNEDIDIENINFMDSLEYEILTPQSKFIIKGRQVYLDNINISSLTPHIDVNGLQEGTHTLQLKMASHPQVEFIQVPNVEVKVFKTEVKESQKPMEDNPEEDNSKNNEESEDASVENN